MVLAVSTQSQVSKANTFKEKETKWKKIATNSQKEHLRMFLNTIKGGTTITTSNIKDHWGIAYQNKQAPRDKRCHTCQSQFGNQN
jgi:hypothetical protein